MPVHSGGASTTIRSRSQSGSSRRRTARTARSFSASEYRRVVGFPGDLSCPVTPSSFPRSGASTHPGAVHVPETCWVEKVGGVHHRARQSMRGGNANRHRTPAESTPSENDGNGARRPCPLPPDTCRRDAPVVPLPAPRALYDEARRPTGARVRHPGPFGVGPTRSPINASRRRRNGRQVARVGGPPAARGRDADRLVGLRSFRLTTDLRQRSAPSPRLAACRARV